MKKRPSWHSASKAEWKEACRREAVIRPLVVEGSVSNAQADQAAQELGVSRSLVYRLVARYRQRAQTSSLLSVPRGRTEQTQWLDKEVETLIRSAVERIYRPIGRPHFAWHIERLIGTVMSAVHLLPGTTFASVTKK
jgi:putative transposase